MKSIMIIINSMHFAFKLFTFFPFHIIIDFLPRRPNDIDNLIGFALYHMPHKLSIRCIGFDQDYILLDYVLYT